MSIRDIMRRAQGRKPVTVAMIKGVMSKVTIKFSGNVFIDPKKWIIVK